MPKYSSYNFFNNLLILNNFIVLKTIEIMSEIGHVIWTKDYHLKWSDFKAESNPAVFENSHSVIKYGFTWLVNSDELNDQIVFSISNIEISVEFHPLLSWVRHSESNYNLLKHEQGNFDLAEMIKRNHKTIFEDKFYDKVFPTRGQNDAQRKQFAKEDSGRLISTEITNMDKILLKKREDYDLDTDFGNNLEIQLKYNLLFEKLHLI